MNTYIFKIIPSGETIIVEATNPIQGDRLAWESILEENQDNVKKLELVDIILEGYD